MRCLLIGGAGFIGEAITRGLQAAGVENIRVFDLPNRQPVIDAFEGVEFIPGNYLDLRERDSLFCGVDSVIYLATDSHPQASMINPERDAAHNILPAVRMMESCRHHGVGSIVFASSGGTIYGDGGGSPVTEDHPKHPLSAYGVAKLAIEHYLGVYQSQYGIRTFSLRTSNAYGPGQLKGTVVGAVAQFVRKILAGETIEIWGDGEAVRDYIFIDDIVDAFVRVTLKNATIRPGNYNLGSGVGHSLNQVIDLLSTVTEKPAFVNYLPARGFDVKHIVLDTAKLAAESGWRAQTDLISGARMLLASVS